MIGAIIGDTVGSVYEFNNIKTTEFPFFSPEGNYTDDSVMTFAVADWLLNDKNHTPEVLTDTFVWFAHKYPCPLGGYGDSFYNWLTNPKTVFEDVVMEDGSTRTLMHDVREPYNSWGNGSAMRTSAVGWMFDTLEETERVAEIQAAITHNHPEGIKGAQATSAAIFMARTGKSKAEIKQYIEIRYGYNLSWTCDQIRPNYKYDVSCQGTVPQAMIAFMDSHDFESCIRFGVSLGGDSDTLCCIAGGIAEAFYKYIPEDIVSEMWNRLPDDFRNVLRKMDEMSFYQLPEVKMEKPEKRISPGKISALRYNEIFVFGSNLGGQHGGGAARMAHRNFGAEWGVGVGLTGRCYAIPTMQGGVETIKPYVDGFAEFAKEHTEYRFLVTRIGCGIAGFKDEEIAPLFAQAAQLENVSLPASFWKVLEEKTEE